MVKELHKDQSLLIALDLCQFHYPNLLIIYLNFIAKNLNKYCKSAFEFKGLKNNKLSYNCKGCKTKKQKKQNKIKQKNS